jgi:hypothetical protein
MLYALCSLESVVSNPPKKPARPWRVVADELSHANRGDRILELAEELEQAFREQAPEPHKPVTPIGQDTTRTNPLGQKDSGSG